MSERRRSKSIKIGYWVLAVAVVGGLHRYYVAASRAEANRIVTRFSKFKEQHGQYPKDLEEAGITLGKSGGRWEPTT
jgi:hypothetical protein